MNSNEFKEKLLEQKRKRFIEVVHVACRNRNLPIPSVNFDSCSQESQNQLAHIHTDINKICVSKNQLTKMTFDDIEETATHEVAHILEQNHDYGFQNEHQNIKQKIWRAPGGIVVIDGGKKSKYKTKTLKKSKHRIDNVRCNYHLCREKAKLKKCPYCKGFYCSEHSNPKQPGIVNYSNPKTKDIILATEKGHPCPDFVSFKEAEKRKQDEKYYDSLKTILSQPKMVNIPASEKIDTTQEFITLNPLEGEPIDDKQPFKKEKLNLKDKVLKFLHLT